MFRFLIQLFAAVVAAALLGLVCRNLLRRPFARLIVAGGFAIRALTGAALFFISYFHLPIARSLQLEDGLWFFGIDAYHYYPDASIAAHQGLRAVLTLDETLPSVFYTKALGLFLYAFGSQMSVAVFLNLWCYVLMAAIIVRWGEDERVNTRFVACSLAAVSFAPTWILWSLQPHKDALIMLIAVAYAYAAYVWFRAVTERRTGAVLLASVALAALTYCGGGIRWYFSLVLLASTSLLLVLWAFSSGSMMKRAVTAVIALATALLSARAALAGAGSYMPDNLRGFLVAKPAAPTIAPVITVLDGSRRNLDTYAGAGTRIGAGRLIAEKSSPPKAVTPPAPAPNSPLPSSTPVAAASEDANAREDAAVVMPSGRVRREITGLAALFLPRFIAGPLGLVDIHGGRGLWWFAEIDTIFFLLGVSAGVAIALRQWRMAIRNPEVWALIFAAGLMGAATAYAISNFGTLLRHREMVFVWIALLPLACSSQRVVARPAS
jgi:hypothetical protein